MEELIAPCGLDCAACPTYEATLKNDRKALARVAEDWSRQFGFPMTADSVRCTGCRSTSGVQIGHCAECEVRLCAIKEKHETCAGCADYGCEKIAGFLKAVPDAKARLDSLRGKK
jgi:hypothetical protein